MKIREVIYKKQFDGYKTILFGDLPTNLLPTDEIDIEHVEAFYSENESYDEHTNLIVYREREETEKEKHIRLEQAKKDREYAKEKRYQTFLKLKAEFDVKAV